MGVIRRLKDAAETAVKAIDGEMKAAAGPIADSYALRGPAGEVLHGRAKAPARPERVKDPRNGSG